MLTIEIRSLSGQYHATPWDHQVNEGVVEWPPSPWRIARALIATWHLKARDDLDAALVESIVIKLAGALPRYGLPPMVEAHTRHYMPLGDDKTTKIFQSFARIDDEPLLINWPDVDLSHGERDALATLLHRIGFLGRAESWVEARLLPVSEHAWNCAPLGQIPGDDEIVRVLAPVPSAAYLDWREEMVESITARELAEQQLKDESKGKAPRKALSKAALGKIAERVPPDLLGALCCDTTDLKKAGWSQPPGSQWVEYTRPRSTGSTAARTYRASKRPTVARFAVASAVPPRLTKSLGEAEKLHRSLVKWDQSNGPVFTGCDADGVPLQGHEHAFIFPESHDLHGHITHFTVFAEMGFDAAARRALEGVRKLWGHKGHETQLALLGLGQPEDFAGLDTRAGACPLLAESRVWRSRTPFVSTRHVKRRRNGEPKLDERGLEIGGPEHDLRRLLAERGFDEPVSVRPINHTNLGKDTRWLAFQTERSKGRGRRGRHAGAGFEVTFPAPVRGPIAVGYGAHFGLGQFEPG